MLFDWEAVEMSVSQVRLTPFEVRVVGCIMRQPVHHIERSYITYSGCTEECQPQRAGAHALFLTLPRSRFPHRHTVPAYLCSHVEAEAA